MLRGAYLNADMDETVPVKFIGEEVDIVCRVNPEFKKQALYDGKNGKTKVLYVRLAKAPLYGCIQSALLCYKLFSSTLEGMGFEINPYDPCVANKMDQGKQCTITWYVDNNKISHVNEDIVEEVVTKIKEKFGKMAVTRGKKHVFLGMEIELNDDGTVTLDMSEYVNEAIEDFLDDINHEATTPSVNAPQVMRFFQSQFLANNNKKNVYPSVF